MPSLTDVRWSPYLVGAGIGVLSWVTLLVSSKLLGCSTSFARTAGMLERLVRGRRVQGRPYYREIGLKIDWQWMLVAGMILGALVSAWLSSDLAGEWVPSVWQASHGDSALLRVLAALVGGALLGFGARWAGGCTSGHGISGALQLAVGSWISAMAFFAGGIAAAWVLYRLIPGAS